MNDDTNQTIGVADAFDNELRKLAIALDEAAYLLLTQTRAKRCTDQLPSPGDLDVIQGVIDDAAGHISNFTFDMDSANQSHGRTDLLVHPEAFMSDDELAAIYPDEFQTEPIASAIPRSLDRLRQGIEPDDPEMLAELEEDELEEGEPYVHCSPTRSLGSLRHLPIDDFDPSEQDRDEPWTSRIGDRDGRSIE